MIIILIGLGAVIVTVCITTAYGLGLAMKQAKRKDSLQK